MSFIVLKFGGSSFYIDGYNTILEQIDNNYNTIIIVSAIGNTTDMLMDIVSQKTNRYDDIYNEHIQLCRSLGIEYELVENTLKKLRKDIKEFMENPLIDIIQHKIKIIKYGEILSSIILYLYLSNTYSIKLINASSFIINLNTSNNIDPLTLNQTGKFYCDREKLEFLFEDDINLYITQGFIASTSDSKSCLLSRSGSDTSASLIASSINAERLEIWTDVDGIFTADPRIVPDANIIECINYDVCQELSAWGTKVIHPYSIKPCQENNIPIFIKNTTNPNNRFTVINGCERDTNSHVYSIVNQANITVYEIESYDMWENWGFVKDIFEVFTKYNIDVNIITTSLFSITTTTDEISDIKKRQTLKELKLKYNVKMTENCSIISLISNDVLDNIRLNRSLDIINSVGREYLYITHYSSNNMSLSFVVDSSISDKITRMFHREFIKNDIVSENINIWWRKNIKLLETVMENRSSLYIYSLEDIKEKCNIMKNKLSKVKYFYYAMKANDNLKVLETIIKCGYGIECVSIEEVNYIRNRFQSVPILFTPNYCNISDYIDTLSYDNIIVIIDNYEILKNNIDVFSYQNIGIRVDLDCGDGHHEKVVTEGDHSKFGIPVSDIESFVKLCNEIDTNITFLHTHKGSGILNPLAWCETLNKLKDITSILPDLNTIDIGGGFGVFTNGKELDLQKVNESLFNIDSIDLAVEPGRYLVSEAGVLLSRVNQIRSKGKYNYIGIDSGMNALIRPMLYDSYHPIYNMSKLDSDDKKYYNVVGPICESGDIMGKNRLLPNTYIDNIILVENAGAYGRVMASRYNMKDIPEEICIK